MRKTCILVCLVTFAAVLASCSGTQSPAVYSEPPAAQSANSPATSAPVLPSLQSATPLDSPSASPGLWPMATPGPGAAPEPPGAPLTADDYYIVNIDNSVSSSELGDPVYNQPDEVGGHSYYPAGWEELGGRKQYYGVVDRHGKVVLPFCYYSIAPMAYGDGSSPSHIYFYAVGYTFGDNALNVSDTGYFYNTDGKLAFSQAYEWVTDIKGKLIAGYREDGANSGAGVMTYDGKTVVPFTYENIVYLGGKVIAAVGGKGADRRVDFYNFNGTLKNTMPIGRGYTFELSGVLVAKGTNGKYGFIDSSMTWCCPPKWSDVDDEGFCDGYFAVFTADDDDLYVNKYGKEFTPDGYAEDTNLIAGYTTDGKHTLFVNCGDTDYILFDDTGKILLTSTGDINYVDGVILADGKAFNVHGKDLLPGVTDVCDWIPDDKLFICKQSVYTSDGVRLPLPDAASVDYLEHDRFLITLADGSEGVCNSRGLWLSPPSGERSFTESDGEGGLTLLWPFYEGANGKYGLADGDGNPVTAPVYDDLEGAGDGVFEAWCGPVHGLIDGKGNWLWYSSFYDVLLD